ncbi:MAG: marine proteobacterial sortase target protein [Thalassotalea sp.]
MLFIKSVKQIFWACVFFSSLTIADNIVCAQSYSPEIKPTNTEAIAETRANKNTEIKSAANLPTVKLADIESGQLLFQQSASDTFRQAPNLTTKVDIEVKGIVANTHVLQTFTNTTNDWQHALYVFPLPDDAAVNRLSIKIGEREIIAVVKEKSAAKRIYQNAQKTGKKAALLEQYRANLFSTKVANIPPNESITVSLSYFQQADFTANTFSLHFPMAITPRYQPLANNKVNSSANNKDIHHLAEGESFIPETTIPNLLFQSHSAVQNTDNFSQSDDSKHNANYPIVESSENSLATIDLSLTLESGAPLEKLKSLNHSVNIEQQASGIFNLKLIDHPLDKDFELQWQYQANILPQVLNFSDPYQQEFYGLLMVIPGFEKQTLWPARQLTFVLDKSGSMQGQSIEQAKQAFKLALTTLNQDDNFQLIVFNNQAEQFFENPVAATEYNKNTAWQYVSRLEANGGTEIKSALKLALKSSLPSQVEDLAKRETLPSHFEQNQRLSQIVFLTDGAVGNEAEIFSMINRDIGQQRLFTVGLGTAPNRYFMNKAAEAGRGSYQFIGSHRELKTAMDKLFNKLQQPVLTDINFQLKNQSSNNAFTLSTSPSPIPDVYADEPIFLSYKISKDTLISAKKNGNGKTNPLSNIDELSGQLTAKYLAKPWQLTIANLVPIINTNNLAANIKQPTFSSDFRTNKNADHKSEINAVIPALATLWARRKIDDHYRQLMLYRNSDAKQKIIDLALNFNLVTPFTSLVAVEQKISRPNNSPAVNKQLKNNLPAGQAMPKTALNWQYQIVICLLLLVLAGALYFSTCFVNVAGKTIPSPNQRNSAKA